MKKPFAVDIPNDKNSIGSIQKDVNSFFTKAFGRTPLRQRMEDILGEAQELHRFTDLKNMQEETGDLLCSVIQLCNENGWSVYELIEDSLIKIERRQKQYQSLGRKIKVAILGGAFDPPTVGHLALAKFVLDTSMTFDEVWLMPCLTHLYGKKMASAQHRLEMCEIISNNDGRIKVFDYEIKKRLSGETYQLCRMLLAEKFAKDKYDFSIIIGQDNANDFNKWVNYEDLERMMRFVIVPRKGIEPKGNWYYKAPHIYLQQETPIPELSSTEVREHLKIIHAKRLDYYSHEQTVKPLLGEDLFRYIMEKKLYR